ncbi:MAG TPA: xanthine dehydrogenase family protein molybdopterin-binding subunit [Methylomirabilota bacterium]|jgi:carbon-monoxide dehydrogenase large subunit
MPDREAYIGRPLKRSEDPKLVIGRGQYVEDIVVPGLAHLAFVRSPHAHARVRSLGTDAARNAPGVVHIATAASLGPLRALPFMASIPGLKQAPCPYLAADVVDATGVPVAAIVAESAALARDAADLIEVDYEPLPPVADPERGLAPGTPLAHGALGTNEAFSWPLRGGDVDGAFGRAAHVVRVRLDHNRLAGAPMEPRGVLARFDAGSGELTLWLTTQNPFLSRADLAAVLGFPEHKLRVIAPDVGGGFGVKGPLYREEIVAAALTRRVGRPVRWMSTRTEDFLTTIQARAAVTEGEAAVAADGEVIGLRARAVFDLGAHLLSLSLVPPMSASTHIFGPYRVQNAELHSVGVYTNTAPTGPYRGSGRPVGVYLIERLMDEAARATRLDPVEIRRRNFIARGAFPHRTPFGPAYDSGDYARALDRVVELADYRALRREQAAARGRGEIMGIGVAAYVESTNVLGWESGVVRVERSGKVTAITGSSPHGQGHETTFAQIIADQLGVACEDVIVRHGDTLGAPQSIGTFGSRSAGLGGNALARAAGEVRDKGRRLAARLLEASSDDLLLVSGGFQVKGVPEKIVGWDRVGEFAHRGMGLPPAETPGLEATVFFRQDQPSWSFGAGLAVVRVARETGQVRLERFVAVDDCGNAINPLLVDGQIVGGFAQGLGQTLLERIVYGEDGQLLTGTFMEYAIPRADDMPELIVDRTVTPSPLNPLGVKGVGEGSACVAPPAIANAVVDALAPLGVHHVDIPLTAEKIWRAIASARAE